MCRLFDKKGTLKEIFAWALLVSLVVCRATMSIAFTKKKEEEEKKENSIKKKVLFLDKVRSSVPGAEGQ